VSSTCTHVQHSQQQVSNKSATRRSAADNKKQRRFVFTAARTSPWSGRRQDITAGQQCAALHQHQQKGLLYCQSNTSSALPDGRVPTYTLPPNLPACTLTCWTFHMLAFFQRLLLVPSLTHWHQHRQLSRWIQASTQPWHETTTAGLRELHAAGTRQDRKTQQQVTLQQPA